MVYDVIRKQITEQQVMTLSVLN